MRETKQLNKRLEFSLLPKSWRLRRVSIDWTGEPLVLFEEGKPPRPPGEAGTDALLPWLKSPPSAHILVYCDKGAPTEVRFDNPTCLLTTSHIQPFENGWLLGEARGGHTRVFDKRGNLLRTLDLGDASEHIQTTPDGQIWVGYFDEGVYGGGIGSAGLVCFDPQGIAMFQFDDFAKRYELPFIDDCYSLNVMGSSVLLSYYSDFPLVRIKDFQLQNVLQDFGANRAVAVRGERLVVFPVYNKPYLTTRTFERADEMVWELVDSEGTILSKMAGGPPETTTSGWYVPFHCAARYGRMYVWNDLGLYELP